MVHTATNLNLWPLCTKRSIEVQYLALYIHQIYLNWHSPTSTHQRHPATTWNAQNPNPTRADQAWRGTSKQPVTCSYDVLEYASETNETYTQRYGGGRPLGRAFVVGMNPGPWGMVSCSAPSRSPPPPDPPLARCPHLDLPLSPPPYPPPLQSLSLSLSLCFVCTSYVNTYSTTRLSLFVAICVVRLCWKGRRVG